VRVFKILINTVLILQFGQFYCIDSFHSDDTTHPLGGDASKTERFFYGKRDDTRRICNHTSPIHHLAGVDRKDNKRQC